MPAGLIELTPEGVAEWSKGKLAQHGMKDLGFVSCHVKFSGASLIGALPIDG
jgi:hypothetical protein